MNEKNFLIDNEELIKEWNYEKNSSIDPRKISYGSHKKVWWKCSKCENEWQAQIYTRVKGFGKCPKCK